MLDFLKRLFRKKPKQEYPPCFIHNFAITENNITAGESKKLCRGIKFGWACVDCPYYIVTHFWERSLRRKP